MDRDQCARISQMKIHSPEVVGLGQAGGSLCDTEI